MPDHLWVAEPSKPPAHVLEGLRLVPPPRKGLKPQEVVTLASSRAPEMELILLGTAQHKPDAKSLEQGRKPIPNRVT